MSRHFGAIQADFGDSERFLSGLVGVAGDSRRDLYARSQVQRAVALGRGLGQQYGHRAFELYGRQLRLAGRL
jgi:hypothetical protein